MVELIIVVNVEEFLNAVSPKLLFAFFDRLRVFPLLVVYVILIEIVHRDVRYVGRVNAFASELMPVEIFEPGMLLKLIRPIDKTNTILRLSLQTPVDKICGFY